VALSGKGLEKARAEIAEPTAGSARPPSEIPAVLCGNIIPTHDGHFWQSPAYRKGLERSVSRRVEDGFYWLVPMLLKIDAPLIEKPEFRAAESAIGRFIENPEFQAAQGAIGRFVEAPGIRLGAHA
jgi:hypothetical protein